MKRVLMGALLLGLTACGSSSPTPTPKPTKTVDDIVLTPTQLSVPLTTFDAGTYPVMSVLVGTSIYFGNGSNSGKPQFLTRYTMSSNTFSPTLAVSPNVCFCGYSSKLVSDGVNIFYIANDATKYTVSSNAWTTLTYPVTARDNAGEAGVTYYNGNIYFVGGRTPTTLFKYYNIAQDAWFTAPNYLYATNRSQMAVYKDRIYVLGGENATKKMSYFSVGTSTWTALKDTPFAVSASYDSVYTAVLGDDLYLLQGDSVYIYDLVKDVWATAPAKLNGVPDAANLFSDGQNLYIAGQNSSRIPAVVKVAVSIK